MYLFNVVFVDILPKFTNNTTHNFLFYRFYNLYHSWVLRWMLYLFIAIDLALAMFEKPANPDMLWPIGVSLIFILLSYLMFCRGYGIILSIRL